MLTSPTSLPLGSRGGASQLDGRPLASSRMTRSDTSSTDDDLATARTPAIVRSAAAALLMSGSFGGLHVLQLYGVIDFIRGFFAFVPHLMSVESVAAAIAGVALARARGWAPVAAIVIAALLAVTAAAWFL